MDMRVVPDNEVITGTDHPSLSSSQHQQQPPTQMKFVFSEDSGEGFIGSLIMGGFFKFVRGCILIYLLSYIVLNLHLYTTFYTQEKAIIEEAADRYQIACLGTTPRQAVLFYNTCQNDRMTKDKYPAWEAFARVARKQQLCGEEGCGAAAYIMIGTFVGCLFAIIFLPRLQVACTQRLNDFAHGRDGMYHMSSDEHAADQGIWYHDWVNKGISFPWFTNSEDLDKRKKMC